MNKGIGFLNRIPKFNQKLRTADLELFLDALVKPALLIDSSTWIILHANSRGLVLLTLHTLN